MKTTRIVPTDATDSTDRLDLILGTRGSKLALVQSSAVARALEQQHPGLSVTLRAIRTTGDHITDVALSKIGDKGLFVKEIEQALLEGSVDFAVHSMKDMPTALPEGLIIACVPRRLPPLDCLVSLRHRSFEALPPGARIATGSLRRRAQLKRARPDLVLEELRGNLPTRIIRMQERGLDGTILALAGLSRMGIPGLLEGAEAMAAGVAEEACVHFSLSEEWGNEVTDLEVWISALAPSMCLPAVGQGALCLQTREDAAEVRRLLAPMDDPHSHRAIRAERALMHELEGGCQVPVGGWAREVEGRMRIDGVVASLDGQRCITGQVEGSLEADPEGLGRELANVLVARGGREILEAIRQATAVDPETEVGG